MSKEETHQSFSLPIYLDDLHLANEIASEFGISIYIRPWLFTSNPRRDINNDMISIYCEDEEKAKLFERAFERRRLEDSKRPGGE